MLYTYRHRPWHWKYIHIKFWARLHISFHSTVLSPSVFRIHCSKCCSCSSLHTILFGHQLYQFAYSHHHASTRIRYHHSESVRQPWWVSAIHHVLRKKIRIHNISYHRCIFSHFVNENRQPKRKKKKILEIINNNPFEYWVPKGVLFFVCHFFLYHSLKLS